MQKLELTELPVFFLWKYLISPPLQTPSLVSSAAEQARGTRQEGGVEARRRRSGGTTLTRKSQRLEMLGRAGRPGPHAPAGREASLASPLCSHAHSGPVRASVSCLSPEEGPEDRGSNDCGLGGSTASRVRPKGRRSLTPLLCLSLQPAFPLFNSLCFSSARSPAPSPASFSSFPFLLPNFWPGQPNAVPGPRAKGTAPRLSVM